MNVDFVTGLRLTPRGKDAIMPVSDRASKQVHLVPLNFKGSSAEAVARLYVDTVWRLHDMPMQMYIDRDYRFTSAFWKEVAKLTGMMSDMTTIPPITHKGMGALSALIKRWNRSCEPTPNR